MKKTYIQPENTVVVLNVRESVLQASPVSDVQGLTDFKKGADLTEGSYDSDGREVINTPDAWGEW